MVTDIIEIEKPKKENWKEKIEEMIKRKNLSFGQGKFIKSEIERIIKKDCAKFLSKTNFLIFKL